MTSFQRMVLVAAVLFMITTHVTEATLYCACFKNDSCEGEPGDIIANVSNIPCTIKMIHF